MRTVFLSLLVIVGFLMACSPPEPEVREIQSALAQEAQYLLSRPDPNNYGLSLEGLIKASDFSAIRGYLYGDFYLIKVDYKVKLIKGPDEMTTAQIQAAKSAFGRVEQGVEKWIRSHELKLVYLDGQWRPSHHKELKPTR
jgi:hypothetical protein